MLKRTFILLVIMCVMGNFVVFILSYFNMDKEVFSSNKEFKKVVAELPEEKIKLYAISKDNGMYTTFILKIRNSERYFNWQSVTNETFGPNLILSDLNKDGIADLIVILTTGTGTGVHTEEVHIIDTVTLKDYDVENPIHVIYKNVNTKLSPKEAEISYDGNTIILDKRYVDLEHPQYLFDDIVFTNIIYYNVKDNKLYALIPAQIAPSSYIGNILLSYCFQGKMYIVDNIKFIPIELKK